jgi:hypothetical protein
MCNVPLPPGVNPIAVKKYLSYHIISYHIISYIFRSKFGLCAHCFKYIIVFGVRNIFFSTNHRHWNTILRIRCLTWNSWNIPKNTYQNRTGTTRIFNCRQANLQRHCHSPSLCYNFLVSYTNSNWWVWKLISAFNTRSVRCSIHKNEQHEILIISTSR